MSMDFADIKIYSGSKVKHRKNIFLLAKTVKFSKRVFVFVTFMNNCFKFCTRQFLHENEKFVIIMQGRSDVTLVLGRPSKQ